MQPGRLKPARSSIDKDRNDIYINIRFTKWTLSRCIYCCCLHL